MVQRVTVLLDTSVISQRKAKRPNTQAVQLLDSLRREQAFLSVVTIVEIRAGIEKLKPESNKRAFLQDWLMNYIPQEYIGRILPVSAGIADIAGRFVTMEKKAKRTPDVADVLIAATAKRYGMAIATLNQKHFEPLGIELVTCNPVSNNYLPDRVCWRNVKDQLRLSFFDFVIFGH